MDFLTDLFTKGGVLVYPLLFLLVWGVVLIGIKLAQLNRTRVLRPKIVEQVEALLLRKKIPDAMALCKQHPCPMTNMLLAAILNHEKPEPALKEILEEAGRQQIPGLKRHLSVLGTIASVAPLLGLLGTVLGMISVFATLAGNETVKANMLAGGISEALLTTALGMVVAMPTLAFHNFFISALQNLIVEMEKISLHMIKVLKQ
jgi:biopolymer transport protein ExbB